MKMKAFLSFSLAALLLIACKSNTENTMSTLTLTQEWGKPAVPMTPGTIIAIPAEVKHWHGAAKDSWFQHLTYHKDVQEGASNEWLEPVTDGQYDAL